MSLVSRGDITNGELKRPTTAVSLSNLARFRIRRYFEEKLANFIIILPTQKTDVFQTRCSLQ